MEPINITEQSAVTKRLAKMIEHLSLRNDGVLVAKIPVKNRLSARKNLLSQYLKKPTESHTLEYQRQQTESNYAGIGLECMLTHPLSKG